MKRMVGQGGVSQCRHGVLQAWVGVEVFAHVGGADEQDGHPRPLGLDVPDVLAHFLRIAPRTFRVGDGGHRVASELKDHQGWVGVFLKEVPVGVRDIVKQCARPSPHGQVVHVHAQHKWGKMYEICFLRQSS